MDGPLGKLTLSRADLDRAADERRQPDLILRLLGDPSTRIIDLCSGSALVDETGTLIAHSADPGDLASAPRSATPDSLSSADPVWVFLGRDERRVAYIARLQPTTAPPEALPGTYWCGLRDVGERLTDRDAGLFTSALALSNWHASHRFCPRCGRPTVPAQAGWIRVCVDDGSEHYPRTDPAIIVAVVDDSDRLLLGHNPLWPDGRFSTLAGFVEPGEPLEDAVRREVLEEAGVVVGDVTFLASQPWPFPASLMLGCTARALRTDIRVDGTEVTQARWFTRDELVGEVRAGRVIPPSGVSIARRLVERWYGGPLPDAPVRW